MGGKHNPSEYNDKIYGYDIKEKVVDGKKVKMYPVITEGANRNIKVTLPDQSTLSGELYIGEDGKKYIRRDATHWFEYVSKNVPDDPLNQLNNIMLNFFGASAAVAARDKAAFEESKKKLVSAITNKGYEAAEKIIPIPDVPQEENKIQDKNTGDGTSVKTDTTKTPEFVKGLDFGKPDMLPESDLQYARSLIAGRREPTSFNFKDYRKYKPGQEMQAGITGTLGAFLEGAANEAGPNIYQDITGKSDFERWKKTQIPMIEQLRGQKYTTMSPEEQKALNEKYLALKQQQSELESKIASKPDEENQYLSAMQTSGPQLSGDFEAYKNSLSENMRQQELAKRQAEENKGNTFAQVGAVPTPQTKQALADKLYEMATLLPIQQQNALRQAMLEGKIRTENLRQEHLYRLEEIYAKAKTQPASAANELSAFLPTLMGNANNTPTQTAQVTQPVK